MICFILGIFSEGKKGIHWIHLCVFVKEVGKMKPSPRRSRQGESRFYPSSAHIKRACVSLLVWWTGAGSPALPHRFLSHTCQEKVQLCISLTQPQHFLGLSCPCLSQPPRFLGSSCSYYNADISPTYLQSSSPQKFILLLRDFEPPRFRQRQPNQAEAPRCLAVELQQLPEEACSSIRAGTQLADGMICI